MEAYTWLLFLLIVFLIFITGAFSLVYLMFSKKQNFNNILQKPIYTNDKKPKETKLVSFFTIENATINGHKVGSITLYGLTRFDEWFNDRILDYLAEKLVTNPDKGYIKERKRLAGEMEEILYEYTTKGKG